MVSARITQAWRRAVAIAGLGLALPVCGALQTPAIAAEAAVYRLGPEDKIRLKVFEWRPSQDEVFEWKALNDEFTVNAAGALSIPLAGAVQVQGLPLDAVAQKIGERLRVRMGLSVAPDTAVDIVQYRPFFVAGDVVHPGPYPYHPGLTVLEAVAIAGGQLRSGDLGSTRIGRELISGEGDLAQVAQEADALLIRRARLQAESAGIATFDLPVDLKRRHSRPSIIQTMQAEVMILQARQKAFATQTEALGELRTFLVKEAGSVDAQLATLDTQMELIKKELTGVASLVDKGIAIAPRQMALERSVAQLQGDRIGTQTSKLRVQEEISKTEIALIELRNGRASDVATELRDTQTKLDALATRTDTASRLLYETRIAAPRLIAEHLHNAAIVPNYVIVRLGAAVEGLGASETTAMEPGDTVKVLLPLPSRSDETDPLDLAAQDQATR